MGSSIHRSALAIFLALLLPAFGLGVLRAPDTSDLNRLPNAFPEFSQTALRDTGYYRAVSEALGDRITARAFLRSLDATIDYRVLGDDPAPEVVRGKNGWLFYRASLEKPARGLNYYSATPLEAVETLFDWAQSAGLETRFVFAPNKASVYSEYLPSREAARQLTANDDIQQLRQLIADSGDNRILDLWGIMQTAKASQESGVFLYYPKDSHWNGKGAAVGAKAIMESIAPGLWDPSAVRTGGAVSKRNDLEVLASLNGAKTGEFSVVVRPGVTRHPVRSSKPGGERVAAWRYESDHGTQLLKPKLLIIHDSFGTALMPLLSPYFTNSVFINLNDTNTAAARELARGSDIVVFVKVERSLYQMTGDTPLPPHKTAEDLHGLLKSIADLNSAG